MSTKRPIHVTLRSSLAKGPLSLRNRRQEILALLDRHSKRWNVRVYRVAVNSNHLHLAIRGKTREGLQNFFRVFAGLIARLITGAQKGKAFGKFWDHIIWSRLATWGNAFDSLKRYLYRNELEAQGAIPYDRTVKLEALFQLPYS